MDSSAFQDMAGSPELPGRFTHVQYLAEGAFGRVFRAQDGDGHPVAIKVLAADRAVQPQVTWQFGTEFRRLMRLDHPAIPRAREAFLTAAGLPSFSMDLIEGRSLADLAPATPAHIRSWLVELARVLAYLHGMGLVHGDLKPANLIAAASGRLVLLDVGQSAVIGAPREAIAGTLEYMAPEVLRKAPVDPAADWYAVGAVGYHLLTGHPPFEGTPGELVRAHLDHSPPPLDAADPALVALIMALLAKDPARRPGATGPAWAALGLDDLATGDAGRIGLAGAAFVGRNAPRQTWQQILDHPLAGEGPLGPSSPVLAIAGPYGAGKSRLLDELRVSALRAGRIWLSASCVGACEAPGAPVRQLLRQAIAAAKLTPGSLVQQWLAGDLPAELLELDPKARLLALDRAISDVLASAAAGVSGGLAIGLDDWHQADETSKQFFHYAQRNLLGQPIVWVLATETDEIATDGFLGALSDDEAIALVASRLAGPLPEGLAKDLLPLANGSPLLLELLLEEWVAQGHLTPLNRPAIHEGDMPETSSWRYTRQNQAVSSATVSASLAGWWNVRRARLSPAALHMAFVAAVALPAGALPIPLLAGAGDDLASGLDEAVDTLAAQGVAVVVNGTLRLAFPLLAGLVLAEVPIAERQVCATALTHRLLADAAGGEGPSPGPRAPSLGPREVPLGLLPFDELSLDDALRAAWLALAGNEPALGWTLAAVAGRKTFANGDPAAALRLLEAGLAVVERAAAAHEHVPPAARLALLLPKAEVGIHLDAIDQSLADFDACLEWVDQETAQTPHQEPDIRNVACRALVGAAICRQMKGEYELALALACQGGELAAAMGERLVEARATLVQARQLFYSGETQAAIARTRLAVERASGLPTAVQRGKALALLGALLVQANPSDSSEGIALLCESRAIAEATGDRLGAGQASDNLGNAYLALGDLVAAWDAFSFYGGIGREAGSQSDRLSADLNLALVAAERGDAVRARTLAEDVTTRARAIGRKFPLACALVAQAQAAWRSERASEAPALLERALAIAVTIKNRYLEEMVRLYRLEGWLALGNLPAAEAELAVTEALNQALGNADAATRLAGLRAKYQGLVDDPAAEASATALLNSHNRWAVRQGHRLLARAKLAAGSMDEAAVHARAALAIATGWDAPWHEAADQALIDRALGHASSGPVAAPAAADEAVGLIDAEHWRQFAWALAAPDDEAGLTVSTLQCLLRMARATRGYVLGYDKGALRSVVYRGIDYETELANGFSRTIVEHVLFAGEPLYLTDASSDANWQNSASIMALDLKTVICLPVAVPDRILGVLYMERDDLDPLLSQSDIATLEAATTLAAAAIVRERARSAAEAAVTRLGHCAALGARLASALPIADVRAHLLAAMREACGAERAFWLVPGELPLGPGDGPSPVWEAIASIGPTGGTIPFTPGIVSQSIPGWVARSGEPMALLDAQLEPDWQAQASVQAMGLRQVLALPVPGGVVYLDASHEGTGDPEAALATLQALLAFTRPLLTEMVKS